MKINTLVNVLHLNSNFHNVNEIAIHNTNYLSFTHLSRQPRQGPDTHSASGKNVFYVMTYSIMELIHFSPQNSTDNIP